MTRITTVVAAVLLAGLASGAMAANTLDRRVDAATEVLQQINRIPEKGIPPSLLRRAYAVAVIPSVLKAGFIVGGAYGKGLLVVRQPDGQWSNPAFIKLRAGSIGWQIGAQSSDIILVFKSRKGLDSITRGKITLGADAAVAAGPVGRQTSAATDLQLKSEIYSYSRSRGIFAGISLAGSVLSIDRKANYAYYESGQITVERILGDSTIPTPAHARQFVEVLAATAPRLEWQVQPSRTASSNAKVYAIEDGSQARGDAIF